MAWRRPAWITVLYTVLWVLLLALLPWWLGLPVLLALVAAVLLLQQSLDAAHTRLIRYALRWGLPGWLFALQRALGGGGWTGTCGARLRSRTRPIGRRSRAGRSVRRPKSSSCSYRHGRR